MGLNLQYNLPNIRLSKISGPDSTEITLFVEDYRRFIEDLLQIKEGGTKNFVKFSPEKISISIVNLEGSKFLKETE